MKKLFYVLIFAGMLLGSVLGCQAAGMGEQESGAPEVAVSQEKLEHRNDKGELCLVLSYDTVHVNNAEQYGALSDAIQSGHNLVWQNRIESLYKEFKKTAEEFKKNSTDSNSCFMNSNVYFTTEQRTSVKKADKNIVSLLTDVYEWYGSAHPNTGTLCVNYNPATGGIYRLKDFIAPEKMDAFLQKAAKPALKKINEGEGRHFDSDYLTELENCFARDGQAGENLDWTWDGKALTLYFDHYTFGSYMSGAVKMVFPAEKYGKYFRDTFSK